MQRDNLISAAEFCSYHHIETNFIHSLSEYGLVKITTLEDDNYINAEDLSEVESLMRLHYDLNINLEGIDAVKNLLEQIKQIQNEIIRLKAKLDLYGES